MKKITLLIFSVVFVGHIYAQPNCPDPMSHKPIGNELNRCQIGAGGGITTLSGNRKNANAFGMAGYLTFDYQVVKGAYVGLRGQFGSLRMEALPTDKRELNSSYASFGGGISIHPFELLLQQENDTERGSFLNAFYLGADIMSLSNKISSIYREAPNTYTYGPVDHVDVNGDPVFKDKVGTTILPSFNVGLAPILNHKSKNKIKLVLNAQFNFGNNDDLDGYTPVDVNGSLVEPNHKDGYNFYSLGLRYSF